MTPPDPIDPPAALSCHRCAYDLRATPADGVCPECGEPVANSRVALPRRPAWRDSDPRWRRRMLAGVWLLASLPVLPLLFDSGAAEFIPVPRWLPADPDPKLADTYLRMLGPVLPFSIGVVLLFARERGRRRDRLDWTLRWGVLLSYLVLFLGVTSHLLVTALVTVGIGALLQSIPLANQPRATGFIVWVGTHLIWYGPQDSVASWVATSAAAGLVVLLACAPLFRALRAVGRPRWAIALILPLALAAVYHVGKLAWVVAFVTVNRMWYNEVPDLFFGSGQIVFPFFSNGTVLGLRPLALEWMKWLDCVAIAVYLTVAQVASWRKKA